MAAEPRIKRYTTGRTVVLEDAVQTFTMYRWERLRRMLLQRTRKTFFLELASALDQFLISNCEYAATPVLVGRAARVKHILRVGGHSHAVADNFIDAETVVAILQATGMFDTRMVGFNKADRTIDVIAERRKPVYAKKAIRVR